MTVPFPEPTAPRTSRAEVLLGYLEHFRSVVVDRLEGLPDEALRASRLPSGSAPLELLKHLGHVERRWLVWGFEGEHVDDPWAHRGVIRTLGSCSSCGRPPSTTPTPSA